MPNYAQKTDAEILDFVRAAYPKVIKKGFAVVCRDLTDYLVAQWFADKRDKQKTGSRASWNIMYRKGSSGKHADWTEKDTVSIQNVTKSGYAQWVHATYNVSWFRQELLMVQNDPDALFDLMAARHASEQIGFLEDVLEPALWGAPTSEEDAQTTPMGIPFWIQKDADTTPAGDWNGGDPSGFSNGAGGLPTATYSGWKNWTAGYTDISNADLFRKMRYSFKKLGFKKPRILNKGQMAESTRNTHLYCGLDTQLDAVDVARTNNDSIGWDLGAGDGETKFYGHELEYIPYLDNDSDAPIYMVNTDTLFPLVLKGDRFRESEPMMSNEQHNCFAVYTDLTYQYACDNRRRNGVISLES